MNTNQYIQELKRMNEICKIGSKLYQKCLNMPHLKNSHPKPLPIYENALNIIKELIKHPKQCKQFNHFNLITIDSSLNYQILCSK